jgi:hypothetical protein
VTVGGLRPGWTQGVNEIPVTLVRRTTPSVRVCITDGGPARLAIGGINPDPGFALQVIDHGRTTLLPAGLRFDYFRPGSESWWSLLPTLAYRMTLARGDVVRHWAPWGALVLVMLAGGLAVRVLAREGSAA